MNNSTFKAKCKRIIAFSIFTTLASQVNIFLFDGSFIASLGVICIPLFMYLFDEVKIIPTGFIAAIMIFLLRVLFHLVEFGTTKGTLNLYLPETAFYFVVSVLLYLFDEISNHTRKLHIFIPGMIVIDFIGNELELFARLQAGSQLMIYQHLIIIVACIRGILLLVLLVMLDQYRILLLSKTHAERYQRLIMLISKLNSEVVWMEKNFNQIEKTMSTSYALYDELMEAGNQKAANDALSIAKDIHEIKKEYRLIWQGLSENIKQESGKGIELQELFAILIQSVQNSIAGSGKKLIVAVNCQDKLFTNDPYLFLSIFHNLIGNAIDAANFDLCTVRIDELTSDDKYVFVVTDNGPGVPAKYANRIFEPRFSTKVNYDTGAVNRGLGLPIVKDIVEENFGGKIKLSNTNHGARFIITIPKERLEVIS